MRDILRPCGAVLALTFGLAALAQNAPPPPAAPAPAANAVAALIEEKTDEGYVERAG